MPKIIRNYSLLNPVGQGVYGKVYHATDLDTSEEVALKVIPISTFNANPKLLELTSNQIITLGLLRDSPYVIRFIEKLRTRRNVYMVYEYCKGGTLEQYIQSKGKLNEREALIIFRQIMAAFADLSQRNVLHRDVKSDNIFLKDVTDECQNQQGGNHGSSVAGTQKGCENECANECGKYADKDTDNGRQRELGGVAQLIKSRSLVSQAKQSPRIKLADFGFCKRMSSQNSLAQTALGSPVYMAPQVLNNQVYGSKADVWSCGIVLYEMLYGVCPFSQCSLSELIKAYSTGLSLRFEGLSPIVQTLLKQMLEVNQFKRISWEDLLYLYEIGEDGSILRKQKDFEYDFMKLIKQNKQGVIPLEKIMENEQVESEEWDYDYEVIRRMREVSRERLQIREMCHTLQQVLKLDNIQGAVYLLMRRIENKLRVLREQLWGDEFAELKAKVEKQYSVVSHQVNSMTVSLMGYLDRDVFGSSRKTVKRYINDMIDSFQSYSENCTRLNGEGKMEDALLLLKMIRGIMGVDYSKKYKNKFAVAKDIYRCLKDIM